MALSLLCRSHHYYSIAAPKEGGRAEAEAGPGWGRKHCRNSGARTWVCTQVIFVRGDQKAFTFRCFPDMNIQHPYWNLIWVSLSQGSFHQCLLPEATTDWQPNFSKEQAGEKRDRGVGDVKGCEAKGRQEQMSGGLLWEVGVFNLLVCMHKQNAADKYEVFIVNYLTIYLPPSQRQNVIFCSSCDISFCTGNLFLVL